MRRSDREITDINEILGILDRCEVCRLGLVDGNSIYVVPINYAYTIDGGQITLWFHGAAEGKKLELIARNSAAAFEMDCAYGAIVSEEAARCSYSYESVMGKGNVTVETGPDRKTAGLKALMERFAPQIPVNVPPDVIGLTAVCSLKVSEITAKRHK